MPIIYKRQPAQCSHKMICPTCKKAIHENSIRIFGEDFCSDICHLRFWKEKYPNLGGKGILNEELHKLEQLRGTKRANMYKQILSSIPDRLDTCPRPKFGTEMG